MPRRLPALPAENTVYLICSPLFGFGVDAFLSVLPAASVVLAVELSTTLSDPSIREIGMRVPDHRLLWINEPAGAVERALTFVARHLETVPLRRVEVIPYSGGYAICAQKYDQLHTRLAEHLREFWLNRATERALARRWVVNCWHNMATEQSAESATVDGPEERDDAWTAAVLVGAGPSLREHIGVVRAARERGAAVVALDTALPVLAAAAIQVDLIVAMDAQIYNVRDTLPWHHGSARLLADVSVHPAFARRCRGNGTTWFSSSFTHQPWLFQPADGTSGAPYPIPPLGTVGAAALRMLSRSIPTLRRLMLIGIDFAYAAEMTHAPMSAPHRRWLHTHTRLSGLYTFGNSLRRAHTRARGASGDTFTADSALVHHAGVFAAASVGVPFEIRRLLPRNRSAALALPIAGCTPEDATDWLTAPQRTTNHTVQVRASAPKASSGSGPIPQSGHLLSHWLERLRAQYGALRSAVEADRRWFIDADLRFLTLDMPAWPLHPADTDARLQAGRLLMRSIADYMRRLRSIIRICS